MINTLVSLDEVRPSIAKTETPGFPFYKISRKARSYLGNESSPEAIRNNGGSYRY